MSFKFLTVENLAVFTLSVRIEGSKKNGKKLRNLEERKEEKKVYGQRSHGINVFRLLCIMGPGIE